MRRCCVRARSLVSLCGRILVALMKRYGYVAFFLFITQDSKSSAHGDVGGRCIVYGPVALMVFPSTTVIVVEPTCMRDEVTFAVRQVRMSPFRCPVTKDSSIGSKSIVSSSFAAAVSWKMRRASSTLMQHLVSSGSHAGTVIILSFLWSCVRDHARCFCSSSLVVLLIA